MMFFQSLMNFQAIVKEMKGSAQNGKVILTR